MTESRPKLLTFAETMAELRLSDTTLRAIIRSGKLRAAKIGGTWRVHADDLDAYFAEWLCQSNVYLPLIRS